jgi:hypothetical protein
MIPCRWLGLSPVTMSWSKLSLEESHLCVRFSVVPKRAFDGRLCHEILIAGIIVLGWPYGYYPIRRLFVT